MNNFKWFKYLLNEEQEQTIGFELTKDMKDIVSSYAFIFHWNDSLTRQDLKSNVAEHNHIIEQYKEAMRRGLEYSKKIDELYKVIGRERPKFRPTDPNQEIWNAVVGFDGVEHSFDEPERKKFFLLNRKLRQIIEDLLKKRDTEKIDEGFIDSFHEFSEEFSGEFDKLVNFFDRINSLDDEDKKSIVSLLFEPKGRGVNQAMNLLDALAPKELDETSLRDLDAAAEKHRDEKRKEYMDRLEKRKEEERARHKVHGRRGSEPDLPSIHYRQ